MSKSRVSENAGWVGTVPKNANGRPECRYCKEEIEKGSRRRTFCSDECVHEHRIRSDQKYARSQVEKRDGGICEMCGLNVEGFTGELRALRTKLYREVMGQEWKDYYSNVGSSLLRKVIEHPEWIAKCEQHGFKPTISLDRSLWDMDHRIPVVEGGGACGLENLRTLCKPCHQGVTKELKKRLAEANRLKKQGGNLSD